jgi:hypothetical protein
MTSQNFIIPPMIAKNIKINNISQNGHNLLNLKMISHLE